MFSPKFWLVPGSILSLFCPAYAEPVHLPLIRRVLPHSDSAVARSLLGVERRNRFDAGLLAAPALGAHLISISFGTPLQTLQLALSITLPGTVVFGCNKPCNESSTFNHTDSSSARNISTGGQIISQLGSGSIPGSVFTDVLSFGPFSVLDASFFVITYSNKVDYGGMFGLSFPSASFQNLPSSWQSLLSSNSVDVPEMGIWLSRMQNMSTSKAPTPGVFTFGGTNSSLYTGAVDFLDSTSTSAWVLNITSSYAQSLILKLIKLILSFFIPLPALTVQGHELTLTKRRNDVAFDVGTTSIFGPISIVATIWAQVPGASVAHPDFPGNYQYPCSTTLNVSVSFGGRNWMLNPAELNGGTGNLPDGQCFGAIIGFDEAEDQPGWIFGDTFLRGVYTVLRQGNPPAIGFAELSEQAGGAPSPTLPSAAFSGSASSPSSSIVASGTPPPVSAKKISVAAVVSGAVGGLILCAAILVTLHLARRHRRQRRPEEGGVKCDSTPEPFVAVDEHPEMAPLNSAQRRFKRKLQANSASPIYVYRTDGGSSSATQPGETAGGRENVNSSLPAAAVAIDVSIMEQLGNFLEAMRRLAERDPRGSIAPPSYHPA
ncbi:aspartic peptidase domain-containing protein [Favolaschia claudopus]|uniref:Aspartic peptidase domain-containing protein n=1 Tax=Favolaschia claudopus TaxID=2862362 RepID=A0AAW0ECW4_9AGAR